MMNGKDLRLLLDAVRPLEATWSAAVFSANTEALFLGDDHVYPFNSITKAITGLTLASCVVDGSVSLADTIGTYIDAGRNSDISLLELAVHTSGLPRVDPRQRLDPGFRIDDPYATQTTDSLLESLRAAETALRGRPAYSNFGYQVLAITLAAAYQTSFQLLAAGRVLVPAGMRTAAFITSHEDTVWGQRGGQPVPPWLSPIPGAGGIIGRIADLAAFGAFVGRPPQESVDAVRLATQIHQPDRLGRCLGFMRSADGALAWHNGGSTGYRSMLAVNLASGAAAGFLVASGDLDPELDVLAGTIARGGDLAADLERMTGWRRALERHDLLIDAWTAGDYESVRRHCNEDLAESLCDRLAELAGVPGSFELRKAGSVSRSGNKVKQRLTLHRNESIDQVVLAFNLEGQLLAVEKE